MNKKYLIVIGGLLAALLVVGAIGATAAYAQGPKPPMAGEGRGPQGEHPPLGGAGLEVAAKTLGMTTDELTAAFKDGKTLQDLADEAGIDIQTVFDAIKAAHEADMREHIAQAVKDGKMTQDKADWLLEGLDKGFLDGPGGFGPGFGGSRGPKDGNSPMGQNGQ